MLNKINIPSIILTLLISFSLIFSTWLFFHTFSYDNGNMLIATRVWSDFASDIPLIRSFSLGNNFPPQYPLFAGPPIHFHFLFFLLVGQLERIGVRIDFALNILSILGFTGLIVMLYLLAKKMFHSIAVGFLTVLFFLFNGTLTFLYFFRDHPLSTHTIKDIITSTKFSSFGPYDNGIVSAFWNLNIFTNQRHFAAALAVSLLFVYFTLKPIFAHYVKPSMKTAILIGVFLGLSYFLHVAIFFMNIVVIGTFFLLFPKLRKTTFITLVIAAVVAFPQFLYVQTASTFKVQFVPGYLISANLSIQSFLWYWFNNLGLHMILIPIGLALATRQNRKIFLGFILLFIIGNLFQLSPEIAANHKFFNYFLLIGSMFSANALIYFWKKNIFLRPIVIIAVFLLILSGIIDFFPVANDTKLVLADYPNNQDARWIMNHTSRTSVFLSSDLLYDSASLVGRNSYWGWPYFAWSAGYDTDARSNMVKEILTSVDKNDACGLLEQNHIDYLKLHIIPIVDPNIPSPSTLFSKQFFLEYKNEKSNEAIYNVAKSCKK